MTATLARIQRRIERAAPGDSGSGYRTWLAPLPFVLLLLPAPPIAPAPGDPPAGAFPEGEVRPLRLEIAAAEMRLLRDDARGLVRATLAAGESVLADVGVRLKGSAGSFRPLEGDKPGFSIKLNRFVRGRRLWGLSKLHLNNAVQDPSYLCETVGNEMFRLAGVPAPRTAFARVSLNARELGLYVVVEGLSRDFLERHFESPQGSLHEGPGDVGGELDLDARGPFVDNRELAMLAAALEEPSPAERWRRLEQLVDLPAFVSYAACETITWHWDGYAAAVNNFHMYFDPATGRWTFLPHGGDQLFQDAEGPAAPGMAGRLASALFSTPEGQQAYVERLRELVNDAAIEARLESRLLELAPRLRAALAPEEAAAHDEAVADLRGRIRRRFASLRQQLRDQATVFPASLELDDAGRAHLGSWVPESREGGAALTIEDTSGEHRGAALLIAVPGGEPCVASWRRRVWLVPGAYRLSCRASTRGIAPNPDEREETAGRVRPGGVCLRISGRDPIEKLQGDRAWSDLRFDFRVESEGGALQLVELVCEARASAGTAYFDSDSLFLTRL